MQKNRYLHAPVEPFEIREKSSVSEMLDRMARISFQGRNLSTAFDIWKQMLSDDTTICMGLAGAMVPAGMRKIIVYLIENRLIDCLVSTGANLFHDIHETLGRFHWLGSPAVSDTALKNLGIDRIYDTFALEGEFYKADSFVMEFGRTLDESQSYSTREFLALLGKKLREKGKERGILTTAAEAGVPVFCPAVGDSSIGIALGILYKKEKKRIHLDPVKDVSETAHLVMHSKKTGVIFVGGGTPKNFLQQTEVTGGYMGGEMQGHTYAIQLTADAPHWGGLSGCTFEEAQSWGKIHKKARMVTVHVDATIALPLLVTGLAQEKKRWRNRALPVLSFE